MAWVSAVGCQLSAIEGRSLALLRAADRRLQDAWRSQAGFTIIEMLTVIAIITILTGLVLVNTKVGDRRQSLRDGASGFVTAAKNAESAANSSQVISGSSRKAYGVCITAGSIANTKCNDPGAATADTYQVYARALADTAYASRPANPNIIATYALPTNVRFSANGWIDYLPPGPTMRYRGGTTNATIDVRFGSGDTYTKRLVINPAAGAVYAQ